jgi:hypothetical protein
VTRKKTLRPDTTLAPVEEPEKEVYVRELPVCCIYSFKEAILEADDRRLLELGCSCGRSWHVTSSLDSQVLARFVPHGGPRADGTYPAA